MDSLGLVGHFFELVGISLIWLGFSGLVWIFGLIGMRLVWFGFVGIGWEFL